MSDDHSLWTRCAGSLRGQLPEATWQFYFAGIEPLGVEDDQLVLAAPNRLVREEIEQRFVPLIEETLRTTTSRPLRVRLRTFEAVPGIAGTSGASGAADAGGTASITGAAGVSGTATSAEPPATALTGEIADPEAGRAGRTSGSANRRSPGPRALRDTRDGRDSGMIALDDRFTFDTFVTAGSNRLAAAAAQSVAENPGRSYNPLFIYGGSGLGKTHLLHAIGNYVHRHFHHRHVVYLTTETFLNDFVDALRLTTTIAFKRRYRDCDVLLIDDVQFLENKESLQEEFFHTYNDLHGAGKQVVLTSDRPPKSIATLEERLRSRFLSGLITKIEPPDLETRLAILRSKAEADHEQVPDDVLELIATHVKDNIRELEGALIRVTAYASLNNEWPSRDLAERVLSDIVSASEPRPITPEMILEATAKAYGFDVSELCGPLRTRPLVTARQVAMYLTRDLTDYSYPAIGRVFGGRDHTTVIHAFEKIATQMKERRQIYEQVTDLIHHIKSGT